MDDGFIVETDQLDLLQQLFERQQEHMGQIARHVEDYCTAEGAFGGLLLSQLHGHYARCLTSARVGLGHGADIGRHCAETIGQTRDRYLKNDRAAWNRFADLQREMGLAAGSYPPPAGGGVLGPGRHDCTPKEEPEGWFTVPDLPAPVQAVGEAAAIPFGLARSQAMSTDPTHQWSRKPYGVHDDGVDWKAWGKDQNLKAQNHLRARVDDKLADDGQTGAQHAAERYQRLSDRYDRYYDRGHSFTTRHLNSGEPGDELLANTKRPGSAWTSPVAEDLKTVEDAQEVRETFDGAREARKQLFEAGVSDLKVHVVAAGPSNTEAAHWAGGSNQ